MRVSKKGLADAHRRLGEAEHTVERHMLEQAINVPDPEYTQERAYRISKRGDRHLSEARRLDDDGEALTESGPAQDPQDSP